MSLRLQEAIKKVKTLEAQEKNLEPVSEISEATNDIVTQKRPNYKEFKANNWIKKDNVEILNELDKKGSAIWLKSDGSLAYRLDKDGQIESAEATKAKIVLSNILDKNISIFTSKADINPTDLILVQKEIFDPHINAEFFKKAGAYYRNVFKPTRYMTLTETPKKDPKLILDFIYHLVTYDDKYFDYFINWIAYFWQTMIRPNTAIALKGTQGTGKGIFFEEIIRQLWGLEQTIQINDNILKSHFLRPIFENKLFYNLDEVSQGYKDNKRLKGMLKGLVTNDYILLEEKHKNIKEPIHLKGAVLVTSNEPKFLEIEAGDRRYTIFSSNKKLIEVNFLVGSYEDLKRRIHQELDDFARLLYHYPVDYEKANIVMNTPEKEALIEATNDKYTLFAHAIKTKNLDFFSHLKDKLSLTYNEIEQSFKRGEIKRSNLKEWYEKTFGEEVHPKTLLRELKTRDIIFSNTKTIKGDVYIIIP
ncbi:primase-helicase family protein [Nitrosophilus labii]|uniref:primase-helicase family protein n=1 Tax=Nitrosophilus labii TaxID=2706014 RepID=UPI001656A4B9|nr:DUF5906 domain-containing protein [Nitrosophilus labii]